MIQATSEWIKVTDLMPEKNQYVLIQTPFCKHPATVGFYNGIEWKAADMKTTIENVFYWAKIFI